MLKTPGLCPTCNSLMEEAEWYEPDNLWIIGFSCLNPDHWESRVKITSLLLPRSQNIKRFAHLKLRKDIVQNGGFCWLCGNQDSLEIDHMIPLSEGGLDTDENLQILCHLCHAEKTSNERKSHSPKPRDSKTGGIG